MEVRKTILKGSVEELAMAKELALKEHKENTEYPFIFIDEGCLSKSTIYVLEYKYNKELCKSEMLVHKILEDVVEYKYAEKTATMLAKVINSNESYWLAFSANNFRFNSLDVAFSKSEKVNFTKETIPTADFVEEFDYLPNSRVVKIGEENYLIGSSYHKKLSNNIQPLYNDIFLNESSDGLQTIYHAFNIVLPFFGPFNSVVPFEPDEYPFFHPFDKDTYHGYWGKDENGNIVAMVITTEETSHNTKHPYYQYNNYYYYKEFENPIKSIRFLKRDLERTDDYNKWYSGRDIWKLTYADGTKAVMFHTVGAEGMCPTPFYYFILAETETKEYFS